MYTIKTLNAISPVGLAKLPANQFEIDNEAAAPQGILVRSADMHDAPLPDSLLAIARAGAGTNNIPVEDCTNKGIVVLNTPGANANAVAELVVGALVAGSRNLVDAVNWAQTLKGRDTIAKDVEKGKKAFVGPELRGKTLGVIGLGAIGARVANAAVALGMEVLGYDPYISIDAAWSLSRSVQHCVTLGDMLPRCDYLTIHVPYLPTTRHTINAQTLAMCRDGVRVLTSARGELVDNAALLDALNSGKVAQYFCDFPTEELLGVKGVCCTPHLGASTPESETNCAVMAAAELSDYLKNGNIAHSVNLPDVSQPRVGGSLRFGEQLHRTGTDPDPRHDMRALQGEPQLRLHTILAASYHAEAGRGAPAVHPSGALRGQESGGNGIRTHHSRLGGDNHQSGAWYGFPAGPTSV